MEQGRNTRGKLRETDKKSPWHEIPGAFKFFSSTSLSSRIGVRYQDILGAFSERQQKTDGAKQRACRAVKPLVAILKKLQTRKPDSVPKLSFIWPRPYGRDLSAYPSIFPEDRASSPQRLAYMAFQRARLAPK